MNPGATETGAWSFGVVTEDEAPEFIFDPDARFVSLSFPIPLEEPLGESAVHYLEQGDAPTANCPGSAADPQAAEGHLCIYAAEGTAALDEEFTLPATHKITGIRPANGVGAQGASETGAVMEIGILPLEVEEIGRIWPEAPSFAFAYGTWAVTAPEP